MIGMSEIENKIGYCFKNPKYLQIALTHSSYANEHSVQNNERLEFLGDAVLSLIVSEKIFKKPSHENEGDLSKIRASLVCEQGLFELSKKINLAEYIKLGRGEEMTGGRKRPSVVSDAFEALLAAIFLDSDFATAKTWLLNLMGDLTDFAVPENLGDFKSMLQERTQKGVSGKVTYRLVGESGPDHAKEFVSEVYVDGNPIAKGRGKSKKDAEQNAAKNALELV